MDQNEVTPSPRLTPLNPEECPDDVAAILRNSATATGGAINIFGTFAHHPGLFRRYAPFGGKLLVGGKLTATDRELVILRTAHLTGSRYEWVQHVRIAESVGLTAEQIAGCGSSSPSDVFSSYEQALLRAVDERVDTHLVSDDVWDRLAKELSTEQLIELTMLVGNYAMLAGFLNTFKVAEE